MAKWEPKQKTEEVNKVADKPDFQMSQLEGIRRGQAYNCGRLATIGRAMVIALGGDPEVYDREVTDKKQTLSYFHFDYALAKISQTYSMDEIKKVTE